MQEVAPDVRERPNTLLAGGVSRARLVGSAFALLACVAVPLFTLSDPVLARGCAVAAAYLVLALTEVVPPFVPTLVLLVAAPLSLGSLHPGFSLQEVFRWPADPVLALFAGGLTLGAAMHRHGIDAAMARGIIAIARGQRRGLLAWVLVGTAFMSMWMSNIAAAAMFLAVLRPILQHASTPAPFRRALLLAVAMGANLGGLGTPIGSGPNALAMAAIEDRYVISFAHWMLFGTPLAFGMLLVAFGILVFRYRVAGEFASMEYAAVPLGRRFVSVIVVFALTVVAWLSESLHGISAPLVALALCLALFGTGLLDRQDLHALDWSTLGLIAGGISLGRLLDRTGLFAQLTEVHWNALPRFAWLGTLVFASASLSAVMSNTGTAALLIPLALAVDPEPGTAVLIAVAASFGVPFSVSTPQNAMVYGEGGLTSGDLLWIGLPVMLIGCVLLTLTGGPTLRFLGIP